MDFIKFQLKHLVKEPAGCNKKERFSFPAFTRKLPKGVVPCDYDKTEKLIELEYSTGERKWFDISVFFGLVICEVKNLIVINEDGSEYCNLNIVNFEVFKEKRTMYWKLILERDELPF